MVRLTVGRSEHGDARRAGNRPERFSPTVTVCGDNASAKASAPSWLYRDRWARGGEAVRRRPLPVLSRAGGSCTVIVRAQVRLAAARRRRSIRTTVQRSLDGRRESVADAG